MGYLVEPTYWEYCRKCGALLVTVPESLCGYCSEECGGNAYLQAVERHHTTLVRLLQNSSDGYILIPIEEPG